MIGLLNVVTFKGVQAEHVLASEYVCYMVSSFVAWLEARVGNKQKGQSRIHTFLNIPKVELLA